MKYAKRRDPLYLAWQNMKRRCYLQNAPYYKYYGGRGIGVAEVWKNPNTFMAWALENGYVEGLTLDRIDTNGDYTPTNCRWVTKTVQSRNTRLLFNTNTSGYRGVSFRKDRNKYRAYIVVNNIQIPLGMFTLAQDAAKAYNNYVIGNKLEHPLNDTNSNTKLKIHPTQVKYKEVKG